MRILARSLTALVMAGLMAAGWHGLVRAQPAPGGPHVAIMDSNVPLNPPGNAEAGLFGYSPLHLAVTAGTSIVFDNPSTSRYPHTVTSITWTGTAPARELASGAKFDSSPTREQFITPGNSWTLDTTGYDPGQYLYYCTIHPWMAGTFTVTP